MGHTVRERRGCNKRAQLDLNRGCASWDYQDILSFQSCCNLYSVYQRFTAFKERAAWRVFGLLLYLVAVLSDTARCLRGDVLRDRHRLHGLERCWVRSGEAAAHALIDRAVPGENSVLSQRALLAAHCRKMIQPLKPESKPIDHG